MRLSGVFLVAGVILAVLAATGEISLDALLAGWQHFATTVAGHHEG